MGSSERTDEGMLHELAEIRERLEREIAEREQVEQALREREDLHSAAISQSADCIFLVDVRTRRFLEANPAAQHLLGYSEAELLELQLYDIVAHPRDDVNARIRQVIEEGEAFLGERQYRTRDGRLVDVEVRVSLVSLADRRVMSVVSRDITGRRQAEAALGESEAMYRSLVELASDGITVVQNGLHRFSNPGLAAMLGCSVDDLAGRPITLTVAPEHLVLVAERSQRRAAGEQVPQLYQIALMHADGRRIPVEVNACPISYRGDPASLVILRDITRRKQMEQQLVQARKMEAVGRLAGAVAHEFNNVLTAIAGLGDLLLESLGPDEPRADDAREIKALGEKAATLTRQLLAFGRRQPLQPRVIDLNARVSTIERMVRQIIGKGIELVTEFAPGLPGVKVDPAQLDQVILNLVLNARDAMPDGGTLAVRTDKVALDQAACETLRDAHPGQYVRLAVTDTGSGIPDEDLGRVFEPFFTTKRNQEGSGLGLSVVYGIVTQHDGWVDVRSTPGEGTRVAVHLPAVLLTGEHPAVEP